jgi:hypothetical protein
MRLALQAQLMGKLAGTKPKALIEKEKKKQAAAKKKEESSDSEDSGDNSANDAK